MNRICTKKLLLLGRISAGLKLTNTVPAQEVGCLEICFSTDQSNSDSKWWFIFCPYTNQFKAFSLGEGDVDSDWDVYWRSLEEYNINGA